MISLSIDWSQLLGAAGVVIGVLSAFLFGLQRMSGYSLKDWAGPRRAKALELKDSEQGERRTEARARMYRDGQYASALLAYYKRGLRAVGVDTYSLLLGSLTYETPFVARPGWLGLRVPLDEARAHWIPSAPIDFGSLREQVPHEYMQRLGASLDGIWDDPLFRIHDVSASTTTLEATFSVDGFFNYRRNSGLMMEELEEALAERNLDVHRIQRDFATCLPIRNAVAPPTGAYLDFGGRMTQGGVSVCLAMASGDGDYVVPLTRRSQTVAGNRGLRTIAVQGMHAPLTDRTDAALAESVYRELFEELEKGETVKHTGKKLGKRWFAEHSPALTWLDNNPKSVTTEIVAFGSSLVNASFEVCVLIAVHDPDFYSSVAKGFDTDWETEFDEELRTSQTGRVAAIIAESDWAPEGKVALIESLLRLRELVGPEVVRLPDLLRLPGPVGP